MKTTFKLESIALTIEGNPVELKGIELTTEASGQEIATAGGNLNNLVELIGDIAERFDQTHTPIKEIKINPVTKVSEPKHEVKDVKAEKPELPTSNFCEVEDPKPKFSVTKEWRKIPVPKSFSEHKPDEYRWSSDGLMGDSVAVDGSKYNVIYVIIRAMNKEAFISIRNDNVKFSNDIGPEDFQDYIDVINIPDDIKAYIRKVVEL